VRVYLAGHLGGYEPVMIRLGPRRLVNFAERATARQVIRLWDADRRAKGNARPRRVMVRRG
jgi:hypothetical protein